MRAEVADVDERIISIQMVSPMAAWSERVISYGVFTAAQLERADDSLADFLAGYASPKTIERGEIKVIVQESGETRVLHLPPRESQFLELFAELEVPADLKEARVAWDTNAEARRRETSPPR
jgi:hypothetical protein